MAGELAAKLAELAGLEAGLAATADPTEAEADDLGGVTHRLRGALIVDEQESEDDTLEAA